MVLALATGHFPGLGHLTANQQQNMTVAATALGPYLGQEQRGVFQTVDRVVASGKTLVTMGSQTSDGVVRQQFFVSTDGGATWRLASVHAPGGGSLPLGHMASRLAGGTRRMGGGGTAGHLDQPGRRELDARGDPWHHPAAARRPVPGDHQHRSAGSWPRARQRPAAAAPRPSCGPHVTA